MGIFLISHKLEEVLKVSDRFTVLRRGRLVATLPRGEVDRSRLATLMIGELSGRTLDADRSGLATPGDVRLEARGVSVASDLGGSAVVDVSFSVRAGEILGVAGVEGSGQVELTECLAGLRKPTAGDVVVDGAVVTGRSVRRIRQAGVGHVPADRSVRGIVGNLSVAEGLLLPSVHERPWSRFGLVDRGAMEAEARRLIEAFDIRPRSPEALAASLSGGNQQKVVLAREIRDDPGVLVACYPTRGLDLAATEAVERVLVAARDRGAAVLYVSTDLDELLALADRIIVLAHGRITGELSAGRATAEQLGLLMGGAAA
jgi:simple sugar transport system ATP-binding protein